MQSRLLLLMLLALTSAESRAQVDPDWLRSWNEALASRPATITSRVTIAAADEPGSPLTVRGKVVDPDGTPAGNVLVHTYHRDSEGFDFGPNDDTLSTWRLQGWVRTDADGRFEIRTIRPAADHLGREGAHIHFTLDSKKFGRQWAPMLYLDDEDSADKVQAVEVTLKLKESADF